MANKKNPSDSAVGKDTKGGKGKDAATENPPTEPQQAAQTPETAAPSQPAETNGSGGKMSALDAAARVLAEKGEAMTTRELIGAMAVKGYWTSPGGKTPAATLYSAIVREITVKGDKSRFSKAAKGRFSLKTTG